MTSIQLFRSRYDELHGRIYRAVTEKLSESEFRVRALPELNPVAWMLWHVGRAEDVAINRLVTDGEQVLDREWGERLGIRERSGGTGMTREEVDALAARIELEGLWSYLEAVNDRTLAVLERLAPEALSELVPVARMERVMVQEGVLLPPAHELVPLYRDRTKGWFLIHLALAHSFYHVGQMRIAQSMSRSVSGG